MTPLSPVRRTRFRAVIAAAFALALIAGLAACSTSPGATLRVLAGSAEVDGSAVTGSLRVAAGDIVEVSGADALVEIQWADGSFTRLAQDTRFEVGGTERGTLLAGTAWSAVGSAASGYSIATEQGSVVAAANTSFAIRCEDGCDGVVASGSVTIEGDMAVAAPATFVLGSGEVTPAGWDAVYADGFAIANSARDAEAGFPTADQVWEGRDPALASVAGFFEGPGTQSGATCTGWPEECARVESTIFNYRGSSGFTFASDCAGTLPCAVVTEFPITYSDGSTTTIQYPLAFDGTSYVMSQVLVEGSYCTLPDGTEQGRFTNTIAAELTPTAAEVRDGVFVVTEMSYEAHDELVRTEGTTDPSCALFEHEWSTNRSATLALVTSAAAAVTPITVDADPLRPVTGPARPSVLSDLRTPTEAIPTIDQLYVIVGGIVVLVLVLGYPAFLLSRVVSDRYDQMTGNRQPRKRRAFTRVVLLILGLLIASLITAALDPSFGAELVPIVADPSTAVAALTAFAANLGSWRIVITALAAFVVFIGLGSLIVRLAGRRLAPGIPMPLQFRWGSLLVLAAGVVASRLFDINPGIIFGLVAGLVIADSIPAAAKGRLMFVSAGFAIVVGILAWVGFAFLSPLAAADPSNIPLVAGSELLSALTLEAVSTMPLAFLPLMGLDGGTLRAWRIAAWAAVYAVGLALFTLILVSVPGSWVEIQGDIVRWVIGFGAFTVAAITIWAIHEGLKRRSAKRAAALPAEDVEETPVHPQG